MIYDPATTRPNPTGAGVPPRPFPGNIIPASRFSAVAKQYLGLAKTAVVPNRGGTPGTIGYVSNNFAVARRHHEGSDQEYSVKLDHTLNDHNRLSYLFNRANNNLQPGSGPAGLPAPFNTFQASSFDADLHRVGWDWVGHDWSIT